MSQSKIVPMKVDESRKVNIRNLLISSYDRPHEWYWKKEIFLVSVLPSSMNGNTTRTTCRRIKAAGFLSLLCVSRQFSLVQSWATVPLLLDRRGSLHLLHTASIAAVSNTHDNDDYNDNDLFKIDQRMVEIPKPNSRRKHTSTTRIRQRDEWEGVHDNRKTITTKSVKASSSYEKSQEDAHSIINNSVKSSSSSRRSVKSSTKKISPSASSSALASALWYQRDELVRHDLLTREEEVRLAYAIVRAKELRDKITLLLQEKEYHQQHVEYEEEDDDDESDISYNKYSFSSPDLTSSMGESKTFSNNIGEELLITSILKNNFDTTKSKEDDENDNHVDECLREKLLDSSSNQDDLKQLDIIYGGKYNRNPIPIQKESKEKIIRIPSNPNTSIISIASVIDAKKLNVVAINADVDNLSDYDIVQRLQVSGGRQELLNVLHTGSEARTEMMRSNIRLVVSIAKKWIRKGIGYTSSSHDNILALYDGGWDRPSFDDLIQEGVLGLARAVDKYDPTRGLRFSTYSSYWISNYIRQLFMTCSTGTLKIPPPMHEFKNAYKAIVKRSIEMMEPIPTEEAIAAEIGTTVTRLRTALRVTESLLSIDQPLYLGGGAAFKGSGAGGDFSGDDGLLISDTLQCSETRAEDLVDVSFLRQCLENALATELSPHERDVIRLRLGLDDGQSRTAKEVAEECGGGVSVSDIRSVEKRAFKKLRNPSSLHAHNLIDFLDILGVKVETSKTWNWYS